MTHLNENVKPDESRKPSTEEPAVPKGNTMTAAEFKKFAENVAQEVVETLNRNVLKDNPET